MAIVVRYFSTTSAGAADGTTWADRAEFISGGAYSTIITAFDFNSTDTLECRIGPGTYNLPSTFNSSIFSVSLPRPSFPLFLHGCDSNGDRIIPDLEWNCAQGPLDTTGFPVFDGGTTFQFSLSNCFYRCLRFTAATSGSTLVANNGTVLEFCFVQNTRGSGGEAVDTGVSTFFSCEFRMPGKSSYDRVCRGNGALVNCRLVGSPEATSGNRFGIAPIATGFWWNARGSLCVIDCPGVGVYGAPGYGISNATVYNCGTGISLSGNTGLTSNNSLIHVAGKNFVANCSIGIQNVNIAAFITSNRVRATTPISLYENAYEFNNDTTSGNDADEFVDAANGDFRIKSTSIYWGKGYGAGDEPTSGGGTSKPVNPFQQTVIA